MNILPSRQRTKTKRELIIISYANKNNRFLNNYKRSLKKYKYKYKFVGKGEKWENYMTKINAYYKYLLKYKNKYKLACLTDAYDVLCCGPEKELLTKYYKIGKKVIFSAETNCLSEKCIYLDNLNKKKEYKVKEKNKYLNSGFILGDVDKLIEIMKKAIDISTKYGITDDQLIMCMIVKEDCEDIKLDTNTEIIGTIGSNMLDYKFKNDRIYNENTNKKVCFIHSPGVNSDMGFRLDSFGKKILKEKYEDDLTINKLKNFYKHINENKLYKRTAIIVIILLLIILFIFPKIILLYLIIIAIIVLYLQK